MSIAPFLPQVQVPTTAAEGGPATGAPAGEADAATGFGDALAAALAGAAGVVAPALPESPALVEVRGAPATSPPLVEVRGAPATSLGTTRTGAGTLPTTAPLVDVGGASATSPALIEVRGAPATSPETTGPGAGTLPTTAPLPGAQAALVTPVVEVRGAPATSPETTDAGAGAGTLSPESAELEQLAADRRTTPVAAGQRADDAPTEAPRAAPPATSDVQSSHLVPPTAQLRGAEGTVAKAVVQQVFPEVTRMISSSGNGTHRITLTLQPAQLGEVRVTLVVRDGSVQVRLAGGDGDVAVQRALASGAPDLQRLLERGGAEARVVVRDLAGTASAASLTQPTPSAAGSSVGQQPAGAQGQAWSEGQGSDVPWGGSARGEGEQAGREQSRRPEPSHPLVPTTRGTATEHPIDDPVNRTSGRLDRTV